MNCVLMMKPVRASFTRHIVDESSCVRKSAAKYVLPRAQTILSQ